MKPIIFCGYSGTGKTTLIRRAAKGLSDRGYRVGYIKHSPHFNREDFLKTEGIKDTEILLESGVTKALILADGLELAYNLAKGGSSEKPGRAKSEILTGKRLRKKVRELIQRYEARGSGAESINLDYLLIEGFKGYDGPIAKVLFGKNREDIAGLRGGLDVAYGGIGTKDYGLEGLQYLPEDTGPDELADFIEKNSVEFPADLDCGECGFPTCREFARELLSGGKSIRDCPPLGEEVVLTVNGRRVVMKGFVRKTLRDVVLAYVENLHDTETSSMKKVQITIREKGDVK